MDNAKLAIATMIKFLLIISVYGFSTAVSAETSAPKVDKDGRHLVTFTRDSDYKCTQCHKDAKQALFGTHGEEAIEKIGKEVKCVQCHNSIGPEHRENAPQVTKYFPAQSKKAANKHLLNYKSILDATASCNECHTPERLQKKAWVHDVHAKNATCSNCHVIHADGKKEGIQSKAKKDKIEYCVECHQDFNSTDEKGD